MAVTVLTADNFQKEVLESNKTVLVDFWASWCGPCRMLSPLVDEIGETVSTVKVGKVNVDEEMELLKKADCNCRLVKGQVFLWPGATDWEELWQ